MESLLLKVWLNTDEAAIYLSTTKKGILNRVSRGDLPVYTMGHRNLYKRVELDQLLERSGKNQDALSNQREEGN